MNAKRLKDPLYSYIELPSEIMSGVVDTAPFQRLRRIMQTSYAPLYSSAVHNRFVHSLGVYHLGKIAVRTLCTELNKQWTDGREGASEADLKQLEYVFLLACLLHDVGHAPFSHTGETFYLKDGQDYEPLHQSLIETVGTDTFERDVPTQRSEAAAPHEIMSAIIGIQEFGSFMFEPWKKEFFARCITGYTYRDGTWESCVRNCFIQLLNSKVIDVDKLDYLIRDAYITGYCTVNIDYNRLLTSLTVIPEGDAGCALAYHKGAVSVIENVVYAHDSERKWIQNHPVILYEGYILQHLMEFLKLKLDSKQSQLFSAESLGRDGQHFQDGTEIRLLSDDDIIHMAKRYYAENSMVSEYFERRERRHPLWKSEAEYKAFFQDYIGGGIVLTNLESAMEATAKYLSKSASNWVINKRLIGVLEKDLDELAKADLDARTKKAQQKEKQDILKVVETLVQYGEEIGYKEDFVLLKSSQFSSGFSKPDFSAIKIVFPTTGEPKIVNFGEKISSFIGLNQGDNKFFYLYYKRHNPDGPVFEITQLRTRLFRKFM